MATREYCSNISEELEIWSEKLHNLSSKIDRIPSIDKYKLFPQIEELHIIMTELDDRLCDLLTSCSTIEETKEEGINQSIDFNRGESESFDYDFGG